ncbi:MAG: signal peptide peptidase SppA [Crocinitomicaceae bacterium]|nr:signal peptide peptidase SppA [Crocinitomicaceae bacterium]|tara:strand:- start:3958 stop:5748 length:1791 start_codon:yes stop_codon:yes gene_type:complete
MKPFWRSFWASTLSYVIISIIFSVIIILIFSAITSSLSMKKELIINANTILKIDLNQEIAERSELKFNQNIQAPFELIMGLKEIKSSIKKAKTDDRISGILLNTENIAIGLASLDELRDALYDFKESGKFIYSYSENYSQKSYYLSSLADKIILYPEGMVDFRGLSSELLFFKNALDRLDVDVQIIRGSNNTFKSAVEPFMYEKMSPENRAQIQKLLDDLWKNMIKNIKNERGLSIENLNEIADSIYSNNAENSLNHKLVDALAYEDQLDSIIRTNKEMAAADSIYFLDFKKYIKDNVSKQKEAEISQNQNVAIVYAVGEIISGKSNQGKMGSETIVKALRKAKNNPSIKAIVLRVNSPGGSALASDVIWREVQLTKEKKPVFVSMGDVAASGGYYISCAADRIFAGPNTVTGSIGVFGVIPNLNTMLKNKIGITVDRVETNEHASFSMLNKLSDFERKKIQEGVDDIYDDFISKVANGRDGLKKVDVDNIGQGRVWSGKEAINIELIDEIGNLNNAIDYAAKSVDIKSEDIRILNLPEIKNNQFLEILQSLEMEEVSFSNNLNFIDKVKSILNQINENKTLYKFQARLPYEIIID